MFSFNPWPLWACFLITIANIVPLVILSISMIVGLISDGMHRGFSAGSWRVIAFMAFVFIGCLLLFKCIWL